MTVIGDVILMLHVQIHGAPLHPSHHPTCRAALD